MDFSERLRSSGYSTGFRNVRTSFDFRADKVNRHRSEGETGDGLTLSGLATPFNSPTRIREFGEEFDEQFVEGAFRTSIGRQHQVMQYEHGMHPTLGNIPIAEIRRLEETARGLEVTARVFDNWLTLPVRDALKAGTIPGMSIRFRPINYDIDEERGDIPLVTVREAELRELGPVLTPAYGDTEVELRSSDDVDHAHHVIEMVRSELKSVLAQLTGGTDQVDTSRASQEEDNEEELNRNVPSAKRNLAERKLLMLEDL